MKGKRCRRCGLDRTIPKTHFCGPCWEIVKQEERANPTDHQRALWRAAAQRYKERREAARR